MSEKTENLNRLLREIEQELRDIDLWTENRPADCTFQSYAPFQEDLMSFPEWVQWVMIPSFDDILSSSGQLPETCRIFSLAELAFTDINEKTERLLLLIQQLDELIDQQTASVN